MPRRGELDHRLAVGRELDDLARRGQRIEEQPTSGMPTSVRAYGGLAGQGQ
jgi:hypothetical protein